MSETPLYYKTITEIAELIAAKQLSPVELTTAMLQRIELLDDQLKSYATVMGGPRYGCCAEGGTGNISR